MIFPFLNDGIIGFGGRMDDLRSSEVLLVDMMGDSIKVFCLLPGILIIYFRKLFDYSVDCFISQIFGFETPTPLKILSQPAANDLVLLAGQIAVRIEPGQKPVKRLLFHNLYLSCI